MCRLRSKGLLGSFTLGLILSSCNKPNPERAPLRTDHWVVSTFAGSGEAGFSEGKGVAARFKNPKGIAIDKAGNLYVADEGNNSIRRITPAGEVSTLAGSTAFGLVDAPGSSARFNNPRGVTIDTAAGNIYVADAGNNRIRRVALTGNNAVLTIAGGGLGLPVSNTNTAFDTTAGLSARFLRPTGITMDVAAKMLYVADAGNNKIRRITLSGNNAVLAIAGGGTNTSPFFDSPNGLLARFNGPTGIAMNVKDKILYVADSANNRIRQIQVGGLNPVTLLAGSAGTDFRDGPVGIATFNKPYALLIDGTDLYVADLNNHRIRKITQAQSQEVKTFAGNASSDPVFDGDALFKATFKNPAGMVRDAQGNVYVVDAGDNRIRKITFVKG